jgi:hypothetical protein
MKNLNARAWLALAVLAVVMGLLLFVPAGTVHYWQAWAYLSIFTGASVLTTLYLMRKDPALLERRMSGGPMAEKQREVHHAVYVNRFQALLVVPAFDTASGGPPCRPAVLWPETRSLRLGFIFPGIEKHSRQQSSSRRESSYFDRAARNRSPSDVRECVPEPSARRWRRSHWAVPTPQ